MKASTFKAWTSQVYNLPWRVDRALIDGPYPHGQRCKVRVLDASGHPVCFGAEPFEFVVPAAAAIADATVADLSGLVEIINGHLGLVEGCKAGLRVAEGEDSYTADQLRDILAPFEE